MNTPRADHKLGEARFFLQHLQKEDQKVIKQCPEAFGYYLSAFLNATYSVVEIHELEAKSGPAKAGETKNDIKERYNLWYKEWCKNLTANDRTLWDYMRGQRRAEVHMLGVETLPEEKAIPAESVPGVTIVGPPASDLGEEHLRRTKELGLSSGTLGWFYIQEPHFGGKGEVLQVCQRYVAILERFLKEFNEL